MFSINTDPRRNLVHARIEGMLTPDEVATFAHDEQVAARSLASSGRPFDVLVEIGGNDFQTQHVMQAFEHLIQASPLRARRVAIVRDGLASRMQARRLAKLRDGFQVFDDVSCATAWIGDTNRI